MKFSVGNLLVLTSSVCMKGTKYVVSGFLLLAFFFSQVDSIWAGEENSTTINIGVLARRGVEECLKEWSLTAQYLTEHLPGRVFKIVPLNFKEISPAVENNQVDFVIVNPYIYVELQNLYGVSRMVTLKHLTPQGYTALFGGRIFCKADRDNINPTTLLDDL
jgi:two-component system, sensor histidine kinase and response regulator